MIGVGDEVVCVSHEMPAGVDLLCAGCNSPVPSIGSSYTVDAIEPHRSAHLFPDGWKVMIGLREIVGQCPCNLMRPWRFPGCWFRKVEKKKSLEELFDEAPDAFTRTPQKVDA